MSLEKKIRNFNRTRLKWLSVLKALLRITKAVVGNIRSLRVNARGRTKIHETFINLENKNHSFHSNIF